MPTMIPFKIESDFFLNGITLIRFAVLTFDQRAVRGGLETHCLYHSQHVAIVTLVGLQRLAKT